MHKQEAAYIQQHLANERTYLAWVRTALAMKGIGFLVAALEYAVQSGEASVRLPAVVISAGAFSAGMVVLLIGTILYFRNRRSINASSYQSAAASILISTVLITILLVSVFFYTWTLSL
ncbi:YidH family protein [Alkalicoccus urumqiensis]|uniref:DUF202 domain-containing protein n=1 Tax=Alkalicoccus urumqiensis TaxID=1548213 RepID=A0A2P6MGM0_ALKUR|nr:DUF202 domain-containing protein [Alkalicoccus urumqiensis]PRO65424.1 hypothetical protein C6I21_09700 [Alkalicoccus urumqiensis]